MRVQNVRDSSYYGVMGELNEWGPRLSAAVALAIYVIGLVGAFGVRAWVHRRRTGDSGMRRTPAPHLAGRMGVALFMGSLLLCGAGLVGVLLVLPLRWQTPAAVSCLGLAVAVVGMLAVFAAQAAMGASWRVGVDPDEVTDLVTSGPFALVRNPIFTAMGITLLGVTLLVPSALTVLALLTFYLGAQLQVRLVEEPALERLHGQTYRDYASTVGRFVPGLGRGL